MSKYNINEIKFTLAQKYGLPESELDESVLGIYILIDKMNQDISAINAREKEELNLILDEIRTVMKNKYKSIIYDDPKTAFWGNFGSNGIIGISLFFSIIIAALVFQNWHNNKDLVKNLQNLRQHVKVTSEGYFIPKGSFEARKDGILIKP